MKMERGGWCLCERDERVGVKESRGSSHFSFVQRKLIARERKVGWKNKGEGLLEIAFGFLFAVYKKY